MAREEAAATREVQELIERVACHVERSNSIRRGMDCGNLQDINIGRAFGIASRVAPVQEKGSKGLPY